MAIRLMRQTSVGVVSEFCRGTNRILVQPMRDGVRAMAQVCLSLFKNGSWHVWFVAGAWIGVRKESIIKVVGAGIRQPAFLGSKLYESGNHENLPKQPSRVFRQ